MKTLWNATETSNRLENRDPEIWKTKMQIQKSKSETTWGIVILKVRFWNRIWTWIRFLSERSEPRLLKIWSGIHYTSFSKLKSWKMKILEIFSSILTPSRAGRVLQVRSLCQSVSTKEDKVALKELFPNLVKDGHSNPEMTKMIKEMGEAKVGLGICKIVGFEDFEVLWRI